MSQSNMPTNRLDRSVYITMFVASILSLLLLGFKAITFKDCSELQIKVSSVANGIKNDKLLYVGQELVFTLTGDAENVVWEFGDGTDKPTGLKIKHTFFKTGTFTITAKTEGHCTIYQIITILPLPNETLEMTAGFSGVIFGDTVMSAGSVLRLTCTRDAASYNWSVVGMPEFGDKMEKNVSYVFAQAGSYTIQVMLDGDASKTYTQAIQILPPALDPSVRDPLLADPLPLPSLGPAPTVKVNKEIEEPEAAAKPIPEKRFTTITNAEMKLLITDLALGKKTAQDFTKYLCNGANTKVVANGKATIFAELSSELSGKKGILGMGGKHKIQSVQQTFDPANGNCVMVLTVNYK